MALPRLLAPDTIANPVYHCYSRIVDRRCIFGDAEKDQFVEMMRNFARFCGVRVLTYCIMDNHFHLHVEVPRRPELLPSESELIALISESLGSKPAQMLQETLDRWRQQNNSIAIATEMERWYAQMWDLGRFMKMLKQRFSCWYNRRQEPDARTGTLWESRYRSTLVECGQALQTMAFYIDLNPVRAHMVDEPLDYRWCGYAAAVAGVTEAQEGLTRLAELTSPAFAQRTEDKASWTAGILAWYRQLLYAAGAERKNEEGKVVRLGFSEEEIQAVRDAKGNLPLAVYLHHRVRYFTFGAILGTKEFVNNVFKERREWFSPKRRDGARRLKGLDRDCPLRCARDLSRQPFG